MLTVTLNRSELDPRIAPFAIMDLSNTEYPYESQRVFLIFRHEEGTTIPAFQPWIAGYSVGGQTGAMDDPDKDGIVNIVEFALGSRPDQAGSRPVFSYAYDGYGLGLIPSIKPDPNLAVVGEFFPNLTSTNTLYDGGSWNWNETDARFDASFYGNSTGSSQFGRLKFFWIGE